MLCICCSFLEVNSLHNRGSPPSTIQLSSTQNTAYSDADFISSRFKNVFTEDQDPGWSQRVRIDEKGNNIAGLAGLTANCKCIMMNKICIYHIASDHSFINALTSFISALDSFGDAVNSFLNALTSFENALNSIEDALNSFINALSSFL